MSLTKKLGELYPDLNVILYTGHPQYALASYSLYVCDYLAKPVSKERLCEALQHLRHPVKPKYCTEPMKIITFGNFIVYQETGKVMKFTISHSMAIFAYLIDQCGYPVTPKEIASDVFEKTKFDKQFSKDISKYVISLMKDLESIGYGDVVIKQNKTLKINKARISCDLYDALNSDKKALESYHSEYMIDFP